jgi:hypothetical protein
MLMLFARIVIFTMILTAPLSYTGDKCPDFRPDFRSQPQIQESCLTSVLQVRITQPIDPPDHQPLINSTAHPHSQHTAHPKTSPLFTLHGRSPPRHTTTLLS